MAKPILISGIQPTGRLHLGNYLGALKNFVELQNSGDYQCLFFIADYHSLTIDFNPAKKSEEILGVAKAYLAAGIDPKKSSVFLQSHISESTELAWILNTVSPINELERMTQFKDKTELGNTVVNQLEIFTEKLNTLINSNNLKIEQLQKLREGIIDFELDLVRRNKNNIGLLTYPLLMAADILLYDAKFVPVGDDQLQHLELTRTLARKFNNRFPGRAGDQTFMEPKELLTKTPRVMSLNDPSKKMSKSQPEGCLFLNDSPEEIKKKISRAVTDSGSEVKFDLVNKTGVSNLLSLYEALTGTSVADLEKKYTGKGYGQFKSDLAEVAIKALQPFREMKATDAELKSMISAGGKKAKKLASAKMKEVKEKLGLL